MCWNEERLLPYYLRHYGGFADKIIILDHGSTDASCDIIGNHPKTILQNYNTNGEIRDDILTHLKNTIWYASRGKAHWVIVCDIDEILWHHTIRKYLHTCSLQGITIPKTQGYNMASSTFPTTNEMIYDEITTGVFSEPYCKLCVFNPNYIERINYTAGCHTARPTPPENTIHDPHPELKLFHCKYLGLEYLLERHRLYAARVSALNKHYGWAQEYEQVEETKKKFHRILQEAQVVVPAKKSSTIN